MATEQEQKPWFGKKCANCDAPINYAYKGHVIGWCGKCTDQLRKLFKDDLRREIEAEGGRGPRTIAQSTGGKIGAGLLLGLILGFSGAVAVALYAPDSWTKVMTAVTPLKK